VLGAKHGDLAAARLLMLHWVADDRMHLSPAAAKCSINQPWPLQSTSTRYRPSNAAKKGRIQPTAEAWTVKSRTQEEIASVRVNMVADNLGPIVITF